MEKDVLMRCILQLMSALCALYVMLAGVPSVSVADDWPQWLGPERDTVWRETGILETFPEGGPPLRWSQPLGGGNSGPAVADLFESELAVLRFSKGNLPKTQVKNLVESGFFAFRIM